MGLMSQPVNVVYTFKKCPRVEDVSDIFLWHCRLGHINQNRINRLTREKIFEVSDCESLSTCESCLLEKLIKSPFTEKGEQASEVLGLIHTDVCRLITLVLEMDIIILLYLQMTYRDMDIST